MSGRRDKGAIGSVVPKPSGMVVFSARLTASELGLLRREAELRGLSVSELIRAAIRDHLGPSAPIVGLSAGAPGSTLLLSTFGVQLTPVNWVGWSDWSVAEVVG